MSYDQQSSHKSPVGLIFAPLVACAVVGGTAMMIGRPKSTRSSRKLRANAKPWTDPKVQKAVETAQRALEDAREQLSTRDPRAMQSDMTRRMGTAAGMTRDNMAPLVKDAGERAREIAERLRIEGQARSSDLNQRLRADVAPMAKTFAQEAIDEAEEIIGVARKRAVELSNNARSEYGPEIAQGANALAGLIAAGSSAGAHMLRERSETMKRQNQKRGRRGIAKGRAKTSSALQSAGGQMKYVASESVMVTFWAAACAATIYFVLLSTSQRDRLKRFLSGAVSQVREAVSDFNDVGEEFQTHS